jgi:putative tryptophan/tyrosine transport system substrate-binding protein
VVRGQLEAFRQALKEYGWIEGQNVSLEYRFAEGKEDALAEIAAELVRLRMDVIVAEGTAAIRAAKTVTQSIPIVMAASTDPVGNGLVASLHRPGGNVTGPSLQTAELAGKRLQLLTKIVPGLGRVVVLSNPLNPSTAAAVEHTISSPMDRAFPPVSGERPATWIKFFEVPSPLIYLSNSQPRLSSP